MAGLIWLVLLLGGGYFLWTEFDASANMTSKAYYEACWERMRGGFSEPTPSNPYQAARWKNCELVARRAFFETGRLFSGGLPGDDNERMRRVCPNHFSEVPVGGFYYMFIRDTEQEGGVGMLSFLPTSLAVGAWARRKWPECDKERVRQGYPKIIEKGVGNFTWEKPCAKCS